jgi:hypothetical protein
MGLRPALCRRTDPNQVPFVEVKSAQSREVFGEDATVLVI